VVEVHLPVTCDEHLTAHDRSSQAPSGRSRSPCV
jgi:hypothetical protein